MNRADCGSALDTKSRNRCRLCLDKNRDRKRNVREGNDPEKMATAMRFAESYVTSVRLLQALDEAVDGCLDMRQTGAFLKWLGNDIAVEGASHLQDSGLVWKDVAKEVNKRALTWWKEQCA